VTLKIEEWRMHSNILINLFDQEVFDAKGIPLNLFIGLKCNIDRFDIDVTS
jgi:hypothetical protein